MGKCTVDYSTAHRESCYPGVELDATKIHKNVHVATCRKRRLTGVLSVQEHGLDEARAYQAEIDFPHGFITKNCR